MQIRVDELDIKIMQRLKRNALEPLSVTAKALDRPKSTIHVRIKKLQEHNIILKHTVDLNYRLLNFPIIAFIMTSFEQYATNLDQESVASEIAKFSQVEEVHILSGEWDILVKVHAKDIDDLGEFSVKQLKQIKGLGKSITFISLKSVKTHQNEPYLVD